MKWFALVMLVPVANAAWAQSQRPQPSDAVFAAWEAGRVDQAATLIADEQRRCESAFPATDRCLDFGSYAANIAIARRDASAAERIAKAALDLAARTTGPDDPVVALLI